MDIMWALARMYREYGKFEDEEKARRTLLETKPRVGAYFELAKLLKLSGKEAQLPDLFEEMAERFPSLERSHQTLYDLCQEARADLLIMPYPPFGPEAIQGYTPSGPGIFLIDNEHVFDANPEGYFTEPHYPHSFSHFTEEGARVLAVDLSRASLAFAARKAGELGAEAISFLHGDLLDLDRLDRTFDVIECVGVLHHTEDPERGLGTLAGLLRPKGLMKIGLYSETARSTHRAAQRLVRDRGDPGTAEGIRAARQHLLSLPAEHAARPLAERADFYSLSGCRDLMFHVHERRFTLPEIATMLERAGLALIGFEFADSWVPARYRQRFPDDPTATSFENWHRYERDNPATFASMYAFWVRRGDPA